MEGVLLASAGDPRDRAMPVAREGDRDAFTAMVRAYQPDLLRVCYVILGDAALAEDAAQSAWAKAWRRLDQLRDQQKVRAWLVAIAANEARQLARRRRRTPPTDKAAFGAEADLRFTDLGAALARLSPDERRLIALRYVAELNSDEIGRTIGLSGGAVRHRLMRLLARLRKELDG